MKSVIYAVLISGEDRDEDQLQRWAWNGGIQGGGHQVGQADYILSVTLRSRHGHTFGGIIIILSQRQPRWRPACRNTHTSNIGAAAQVWRTRFIYLPLSGQAIHHSSRVETVVMEVPSRNVGRVIGRRGETVNIRIHILTQILSNRLSAMSCVSKILEDLLLQVKAISRASRCKVEVEPETKVDNFEIFSNLWPVWKYSPFSSNHIHNS